MFCHACFVISCPRDATHGYTLMAQRTVAAERSHYGNKSAGSTLPGQEVELIHPVTPFCLREVSRLAAHTPETFQENLVEVVHLLLVP